MIEFVNPGILGKISNQPRMINCYRFSNLHTFEGEREKFRKVFEEPIMAGRQPSATEKDKVQLSSF